MMSIWSSFDCHKQTDNMNRTKPSRTGLSWNIAWLFCISLDIYFLSDFCRCTRMPQAHISPLFHPADTVCTLKQRRKKCKFIFKCLKVVSKIRWQTNRTNKNRHHEESKKERKKTTRHTPKRIQVGKKNPCMHQLNITCVWRLGHTKNSWTLFLCLF